MKKQWTWLAAMGMSVMFATTAFASVPAVITESIDYGTDAVVEITQVPDYEDVSVTLTVDGVEENLMPGTYEGNVVLTVTQQNLVEYTSGKMVHPFRQAIYVDETGVVDDKSVLAAVIGGNVDDHAATGITVISNGDAFNGIYVASGEYAVVDSEFIFNGDGGNDFAGFGSAIMATGEGTRLTVENTHISTTGVVRTTLTPSGGSHVVVKNSVLEAHDGVLPEDYIPNTSLGYMKSVPWMLGLYGNCRATNMLGTDTQETFINSSVSTENWGILSVDDCSNVKLTGINSSFSTTGIAGYGAYGIGYAVDRFYGCEFDVATYAGVMTMGGSIYFDDSTPENVQALNEELDLRLTEEEMAAFESRGNVLKTGGSALMLFNTEARTAATVLGSTVIDAGRACFLTRSGLADITVDGAQGAQLSSEIGVILQMIDIDKAPRVNEEIDGVTYSVYPGPWSEPYASYEEVEVSTSIDPTAESSKDVIATFANIELEGDFYNGTTGADTAQNLELTLDNAQVTGLITATFAQHEKAELYPEDWQMIGVVENTPEPVINNGVLLTMENSAVWNVTGECYISALTMDESSTLNGDLWVDGEKVDTANGGGWTGNIVVTVSGEAVQKENNIPEREVVEDAGGSGGSAGGPGAGGDSAAESAPGDDNDDSASEAAPEAEPAASADESNGEVQAAPEAPAKAGTSDGEAAPEPPAKPDGEAASSGEGGEKQEFSLYPMEGYEKSFEGYKAWVCDAFRSNERITNLEEKIAAVQATTEETYDPEAMPFKIQIDFGLICSFDDYMAQN